MFLTDAVLFSERSSPSQLFGPSRGPPHVLTQCFGATTIRTIWTCQRCRRSRPPHAHYFVPLHSTSGHKQGDWVVQGCGGPSTLQVVISPSWKFQDQHVNLYEAVQINRDVGSPVSVGIHWGTNQLITGEPKQTLAVLMSIASKSRFVALDYYDLEIIPWTL
ncbi:hypothetical protein H257_08585 [Aphanomyces astaci]|uniref:Uncharacterized protein n=1 Tax=Aphanomyces astaci TaxID=112090 RepID=W4GEM5_APHAT|nr:hypothetical protein H257_08585 [Aphanomyces astaci]ETV77721.1 hypothetical protein H257_08585 [Aphanomyces astaci]|eukprot:XP_009832831.1 hypothetical protein H257_08585 [Aphanomyces astaci]